MTESEWYGRIEWPNQNGMATGSPWPSPNGMAESAWPNPNTLAESPLPNPNGMAESAWPNPNTLAESYALVAAVRNLVYHRHQLVLGAPDSSTHA